MREFTLLSIIIIFIVILVLIIHIYDKHLVKEINLYEEKLEKKGIFKRHYTKQKDNK